MDKRMILKLNGGRSVSGILRGFDPFMNVVIDETQEEGRENPENLGMVVCILPLHYLLICLSIEIHLFFRSFVETVSFLLRLRTGCSKKGAKGFLNLIL